MPQPLQEPAKLGHIGRSRGQSRAKFRARDSVREWRFEGPWRDTDEAAHDDLLTIRAAATEPRTRSEALQAMEFQSIHLKNEARIEDGWTEAKGDQHRAVVSYTDDNGVRRVKTGPVRHDERRAQADLETMRAAAVSNSSRAERFEAQSKEASALQKTSVFEAQVSTGSRNLIHNRVSMSIYNLLCNYLDLLLLVMRIQLSIGSTNTAGGDDGEQGQIRPPAHADGLGVRARACASARGGYPRRTFPRLRREHTRSLRAARESATTSEEAT